MNSVVNENDEVALEKTETIRLPRFGDCSYAESEVITFPWGLPGFGQFRRFLVLAVSAADGYFWLQSLDDVKVAIPLSDPWSIFDDYEVPLPLYAKQSLAISTPESFCVLCVLVATPSGRTINLLAPIIINLETRIGRQITLENQRYDVRTPISRDVTGTKEDVAS